MLSLLFILMLREGSGTDLAISASYPGYLVAGVIQSSIFGLAVIALARWLGNRNERPVAAFLILMTTLPVGLFLVLALISLMATGVQGLSLLDPRRWLEIPAFALTFYLTAQAYLATAKFRNSRKGR